MLGSKSQGSFVFQKTIILDLKEEVFLNIILTILDRRLSFSGKKNLIPFRNLYILSEEFTVDLRTDFQE